MAYDRLFALVSDQFGDPASVVYDFDAALVTQILPDNGTDESGSWVTRNGGTFRLNRNGNIDDNMRARDSGDERLYCYLRNLNDLPPYLLDVQLPNAGTYRIRFACCYTGTSQTTRSQVLIRDGAAGAVLATISSNGTVSPGDVLAADGSKTTDHASYLALANDAEPYVEVTFTGTVARFELGHNDGTNDYESLFNYVRLTEQASATLLTVPRTTHAHTADSPTLASAYALTVPRTTHTQQADAPTLTVGHLLTVQPAQHNHAADQIALPATLAPQDALHAHSVPTLLLNGLEVASTTHAHAAETVNFDQIALDAVESGWHYLLSPELQLAPRTTLAPGATLHAHAAEAPAVAQGRWLLPADDGWLAHTVPIIEPQQRQTLAVQAAVHAHSAAFHDPLAPTLRVQRGAHAHHAAGPLLVSGDVPLDAEHVLLVASARRWLTIHHTTRHVPVRTPSRVTRVASGDRLLIG